MEKYQLYRTALDALQFLLQSKSDLGFDRDITLTIGKAFEAVMEQVSNMVFKASE